MITSRTHLQLVEAKDFADFLAMYLEPDTFRFIPKLQGKSEAEYLAFWQSRLQLVQSGQGYYWAARLLSNDEFVGALNLYPHHQAGMIHLGCQIRQAYWGQGYATEMMAAGRDFAIHDLALPVVYAFTDVQHHASIRLLDKLDFVKKNVQTEENGDLTALFQFPPPSSI